MNQKHSPQYFKFSKTLLFPPRYEQIIFVDTTSNLHINNFLYQKYDLICQFMEKKGYQFIYPYKIRHNHPTLSLFGEDFSECEHVINRFLSFMSEKPPMLLGFLRYKQQDETHYIFSYFQFHEDDILDQIQNYMEQIPIGSKYYDITSYISNNGKRLRDWEIIYDEDDDWKQDAWDALTDGQYGDYPGDEWEPCDWMDRNGF
jgi:hypothetical protein